MVVFWRSWPSWSQKIKKPGLNRYIKECKQIITNFFSHHCPRQDSLELNIALVLGPLGWFVSHVRLWSLVYQVNKAERHRQRKPSNGTFFYQNRRMQPAFISSTPEVIWNSRTSEGNRSFERGKATCISDWRRTPSFHVEESLPFIDTGQRTLISGCCGLHYLFSRASMNL